MVLVFLVGRWLLRHRDNPVVASVMRFLRLAVIGLIAAAALQLMPGLLTATPTGNVSLFTFHFSLLNLLIFLAVLLLAWRKKTSPILLIALSGLVGLIVYSI